jgi:tyrosine-protein kinase Etk/Wzc
MSPARERREPTTTVPDIFVPPSVATSVGREPVPFELDLSSVSQTIRSRWRALAVGLLVGAVTAVSVLLFVPPRFNGRAMVLIRTTQVDPSAALRTKMGAVAELMPNALGGNLDEELSTEIALLSSRATYGAVVDSLKLQVVPISPGRTPPYAVVDSIRTTGRFKPRKITLSPGPNAFEGGTIWASGAARVRVWDREDAIDEMEKRADVRLLSGNTVEIKYRGRDSLTAAEVPNLIANVYMIRRRTVDRGLNQRRLEFLDAKQDSVRVELRQTADLLASVARQFGVGASPEIGGEAMATGAAEMEAKLAELRATEIAMDSLIASTRAGRMDPRFLAGFPDMVRSIAANDLLSQIATVETQRNILLGRQPATSPEAVALERARDSLVSQMLPIATTYREAISQQRASVERDLERLNARIARLPAQAAAVGKEQAELTRLLQMHTGMGVQVLDARLAALMEGGDVRVIDPAATPRKVSFPRRMPTIAVCLALGLVGGLAYALYSQKRQGGITRTT